LRTSTKRKTYGRTNCAQALRTAVADVDRAIAAFDLYSVERKRIRAAMVKQKESLQELVNDVAGIPITAEEKAVAKHDKVQDPHQVLRDAAVAHADKVMTARGIPHVMPVATQPPAPVLAQQTSRGRGVKGLGGTK
jgi:hypothetical protein